MGRAKNCLPASKPPPYPATRYSLPTTRYFPNARSPSPPRHPPHRRSPDHLPLRRARSDARARADDSRPGDPHHQRCNLLAGRHASGRRKRDPHRAGRIPAQHSQSPAHRFQRFDRPRRDRTRIPLRHRNQRRPRAGKQRPQSGSGLSGKRRRTAPPHQFIFQ